MPEQTRFIDVNGARLACDLLGEGPPVVLMHAGNADRRMWADQVPAFARHYRVVSYDLRGCGESSMPPGDFANHDDFAVLLRALGVERTALVGCSLGGKIAIDCALAYPELVGALVLSGAAPEGFSTDDLIERFEAEVGPPLEANDLDRAADVSLQYFVAGPYRGLEQLDPDVRRRAHVMARRMFENMAAAITGGAVHAVQPPAIGRLAAIGVATLVIVGDLDQPDLLAASDLLTDDIPRARKVVMPGVAHLPNMERPGDFNRIVLDFLATAPAWEPSVYLAGT